MSRKSRITFSIAKMEQKYFSEQFPHSTKLEGIILLLFYSFTSWCFYGRAPVASKGSSMKLLDVEKQRLCSISLPDDRASYLRSKGELRHPAEEINFDCLYLQFRSFGHNLKLVTIDKGRKVDQLVNCENRLLTQLTLPSFMNKTQRYLNPSTWGRTYSPIQRRSWFDKAGTTTSSAKSSHK